MAPRKPAPPQPRAGDAIRIGQQEEVVIEWTIARGAGDLPRMVDGWQTNSILVAARQFASGVRERDRIAGCGQADEPSAVVLPLLVTDGLIVYFTSGGPGSGGVVGCPGLGGTPQLLAELTAATAWPSLLPDGKAFVFGTAEGLMTGEPGSG